MIKAIFGFFSGIVNIVIGVFVALTIFSVLLAKGREDGGLKRCQQNPSSPFCEEAN